MTRLSWKDEIEILKSWSGNIEVEVKLQTWNVQVEIEMVKFTVRYCSRKQDLDLGTSKLKKKMQNILVHRLVAAKETACSTTFHCGDFMRGLTGQNYLSFEVHTCKCESAASASTLQLCNFNFAILLTLQLQLYNFHLNITTLQL